MKLHYYPDTDTFSISLKDAKSVNTEEIAHDVVLDFDADGNVISIDIDFASKKLDLTTLEMVDFPGTIDFLHESRNEGKLEVEDRRNQVKA